MSLLTLCVLLTSVIYNMNTGRYNIRVSGVVYHFWIDLLQLSSLLVSALYPNMYYLKKKRQVITLDGQIALIPKNSVNFDKRENASFPSPYFVFSEKVHYLQQIKFIHVTRN